MTTKKILSKIREKDNWVSSNYLKGLNIKKLTSKLNRLKEKGKLFFNDDGQFIWTKKGDQRVGRLKVHGKGFAFLEAFDPQTEDVYVNKKDIKEALDEDIVILEVFSGSQGLQGRVVKVLKRGLRKAKGVYTAVHNYGFVEVDNPGYHVDIFIPARQSKNASSGEKVGVVINEYPSAKKKNPVGEVVEKYGQSESQDAEINAMVDTYDIRTEFSEKVLEEAAEICSSAKIENNDYRRDLRDEFMVTIDGEKARDFDDAFHIKKTEKGFELGVHIADVSHYIKPGSAIDKEAFKRSNSVYLPAVVYPMIPKCISNGICSLKEKENRYAFSVIMEFDKKGRRKNFSIFPSIIKVNRRLTYSFVTDVLKDNATASKNLESFLERARNLSLKIHKQRMKRGSVDLDIQELRVITNEEGQMIDLKAREMGLSQEIIEDFMLETNRAVASYFYEKSIPFLYRIHPRPEEEDIGRFIKTCRRLGHHIKKGRIESKDFQKALNYFEDSPQEILMEEFILGAFQKARYTEESGSHFGLAFKHYTHFTSPIRRYADLTVHRIIKRWLDNKEKTSRSRIRQVSQQTSKKEELTVQLEREVNSWLKTKYMSKQEGEVFEGVVRGVMKFGVFVELNNLVSGLIRLEDMADDYYDVNEKEGVIKGQNTGREYRVGSAVKVRVKGTDLTKREIDFELVS